MKWLLFALEAMPRVIQAVLAIEKFIPKDKVGPEKLDLIVSTLKTTASISEEAAKELPNDKVVVLITKLVEIYVAAANKLGIFTKGEE